MRWAVGTGALILTLGACTGSSSTLPPTITSASVSASAEAPAPPTGLKATQPSLWKGESSTWQVTLTWQPSAGAQTYVVARDGRTLTSSDTGHSYRDTKPQPGVTYRYQVVAVGADGSRSKPATVTIATHVPPLDEARLSGSFVTKLHITSQSNLKSGASGNTRLFRFAPRCGTGTCSVTWSEKGLTGSGTLDQNGTHYTGTIKAPFGIASCFGGRVSESLIFNIRITHARIAHGEWFADAFTGTLQESAATSGCQTGRINYVMTGKS